MNDMTIEQAKKMVADFLGRHGGLEEEWEIDEFEAARGFIKGHASRDPEVEKLKDAIREMVYDPRTAEENRKLKEEYKWAMVGAEEEAHHADELQAELSAEREASRKLVLAAKAGLLAAKRERTWFNRCVFLAGTDESVNDQKEIEAMDKIVEGIESVLKPYTDATPGHSPEGKTS